MSWSRAFRSSPCTLCPAFLVALVCVFAGMSAVQPPARAESISSSDFKIDIASNMAWINNSDPSVGLKLWRQTAMEQAVLASRPYIRVTNNSSRGQIRDFELNLSSFDSSAVTGVLWQAGQQGSQWKWSSARQTAVFNFDKPIDSGDNFLIRVATGPGGLYPAAYVLEQNFFAPSQSVFANPRFSEAEVAGVLGLTVYDPNAVVPGGLRSAAPLAALGQEAVVHQFDYDLQTVTIDPFKTYGQQVGITIAAVPEPSGLALMAAAAGVCVVGLAVRSGRKAG